MCVESYYVRTGSAGRGWVYTNDCDLITNNAGFMVGPISLLSTGNILALRTGKGSGVCCSKASEYDNMGSGKEQGQCGVFFILLCLGLLWDMVSIEPDT